MTFKEAEKFAVPTVYHSGETIGQVALTDVGLKWLDRMRGKAWGGFKNALEAYFEPEAIQRELERAMEE